MDPFGAVQLFADVQNNSEILTTPLIEESSANPRGVQNSGVIPIEEETPIPATEGVESPESHIEDSTDSLANPSPDWLSKFRVNDPANLHVHAEINSDFSRFAGLAQGVYYEELQQLDNGDYGLSIAGPMTAELQGPVFTLGVGYRKSYPFEDSRHSEQRQFREMGRIPIDFELTLGKIKVTEYRWNAVMDTQEVQNLLGYTQEEVEALAGELLSGDLSGLITLWDTLPGLWSNLDLSDNLSSEFVKVRRTYPFIKADTKIWLASGRVFNASSPMDFFYGGRMGIGLGGMFFGEHHFFGGGLQSELDLARVSVGPANLELLAHSGINYYQRADFGRFGKFGFWDSGQVVNFDVGIGLRLSTDIKTPSARDFDKKLFKAARAIKNGVENYIDNPPDIDVGDTPF